MSDKAKEIKRIVEEFASEYGCKVEGIEGTKIKIVCELGPASIDLGTGEVETDIVHLRTGLEKALEAGTATPSAPAPYTGGRIENVRPAKPNGMAVRDVQVADLTMDDIRAYICPEASEPEAFMFLKLCQARNLNPFTNEAYLVKYGGKANMVVGKEAFMRKAELHPKYRGFKAGVIVKGNEGISHHEGAFVASGDETLVGGWCEVFRADRTVPIRAEVSLAEYQKPQPGPWKSHTATMIRKVAIVQAMRESFPSDLAGCYDEDEMSEGDRA